MTVRPATTDDIDAICAVGHATWPSTYAFAPPGYVEHGLATYWSTDAVQRSLDATDTWVGLVDGEVAGMVNLDHRPEQATIWKLYVRPDRQAAGLGSALIGAAIAAADGPVRLSYTEGNDRAAGFYARHGFVEIGREPGDRPEWPRQIWLERP